jgi:hypothetical protein
MAFGINNVAELKEKKDWLFEESLKYVSMRSWHNPIKKFSPKKVEISHRFLEVGLPLFRSNYFIDTTCNEAMHCQGIFD